MASPSPFASPPLSLLATAGQHRATRWALLASWSCLIAYLAAHHVFWRDEVRALTLALSGNGFGGMIRAVQGEGHPVLWYILLRLAHDVAPIREILPAVGIAIGIAAGALLTLRAPFPPLILAIVLFSAWLTYEDTVMARNYGVAALLMFVLADRFAHGGRNGWMIGALLFLLCQTNVPAVLIAGGFLLFWLAELISEEGWRPNANWRPWVIAAGLVAAGVLACFLEVYPPVNDMAVSPLGIQSTPARLLAVAFGRTGPMTNFLPPSWWGIPGSSLLVAVLLLATPFSLLRSPGGLLAALFVLPAMIAFFLFVYPGAYRHQALYLAFLVSLHWMAATGRGGRWPERLTAAHGRLASVATAMLVVLLTIQVASLAPIVGGVAHGFVASRSADFGQLLRRPALRKAIVLGDPDTIVEALPYYAPNSAYLVREQRFGSISHFTNHARQHLTLGELLATARRLQCATARPIVIATTPRFDASWRAMVWREGYTGTFSATPKQIHELLASTRVIARYAPATTDESYHVYLLRPELSQSCRGGRNRFLGPAHR